jgi:hypothetical protein
MSDDSTPVSDLPEPSGGPSEPQDSGSAEATESAPGGESASEATESHSPAEGSEEAAPAAAEEAAPAAAEGAAPAAAEGAAPAAAEGAAPQESQVAAPDKEEEPAPLEIQDDETLRQVGRWSCLELFLLLLLWFACFLTYAGLALAMLDAANSPPTITRYYSVEDLDGPPVLESPVRLAPEEAAGRGLVTRRQAEEIRRGQKALARMVLVPPSREKQITFIRKEAKRRAEIARGSFGDVQERSLERLLGLAVGLLLGSWLVLALLIPTLRRLWGQVPFKFLLKYSLLSGTLLLVAALLFSGVLLFLRGGIEFLKFLTDPTRLLHEAAALQIGEHAEAIVDLGDEIREHTIRELAGDQPMTALLRNGEAISKDLEPLVDLAKSMTWLTDVLSAMPVLLTLVISLSFAWRLRGPMLEIARLPLRVASSGDRTATRAVLLSAGVRFCWEIVLAIFLLCLVLGAGLLTGLALRAILAPAMSSTIDLSLLSMKYLIAAEGARVSLVYIGILSTVFLLAAGLGFPLAAMMLWGGKTQHVVRLVVADRAPVGRFKRYLLLAPLAAAWLQLGPFVVSLACGGVAAYVVRSASPVVAYGVVAVSVLAGLVLWAWPGRGIRALDYLARTKLAVDPNDPPSPVSSGVLFLRLCGAAVVTFAILLLVVWGASNAIHSTSADRAQQTFAALPEPPPVPVLEPARAAALERVLELAAPNCALNAALAKLEGKAPDRCEHEDHAGVEAEVLAKCRALEGDFELAFAGPVPLGLDWQAELVRFGGVQRALLLCAFVDKTSPWDFVLRGFEYLRCFAGPGWSEAWARVFLGGRSLRFASELLEHGPEPTAAQRAKLLAALDRLDQPTRDLADAEAWLRARAELMPVDAMEDPEAAPEEVQAYLSVYSNMGPIGRAYYAQERTAVLEFHRVLVDELKQSKGEGRVGVEFPFEVGLISMLRLAEDAVMLRRSLLQIRAKNRLLRVGLDPKAPLPRDPWSSTGGSVQLKGGVVSSRSYDGQLGTPDDAKLELP